ncbi:MAG: sugar ABC transporter permease [Armatimonadota bacterium]|nr:sugar ABC transporter permease [Armatimonadota bacterium]MDR5697790.1 sugar ABC transporter permease [Armatimonadota bacterium]
MERFAAVLLVAVGAPLVSAAYVAAAELAIRQLPETTQRRVRPWVWVGPALVFLTVFLVYPTVNTFVLSLRNANGTQWVGLANYVFAFTDREMLIAFRNNMIWLAFFTGLTVSAGLLIAVLAERVRYESIAKGIVFLPMALSFVAAGVIWKFVYEFRPAGTPQIGTLNAVLTGLVPGFQPRAWLVNAPENNFFLVLVGVWMWTGFCAVILSAALKGVPTEVLEAGRVDGAGEVRLFWQITLPMIASTVAVVATTMVITSLKVFDVVYVMTNGNFGTEVIANRMYKELFNIRHFGRASAIAIVLFLAILPVMVANIRRFREQEATR